MYWKNRVHVSVYLQVFASSTDLMILDLASHHAEGVVACVVVDVDSAEASGTTGWHPLLIGIVIHHDSGSRLADALFTVDTRHREKIRIHHIDTRQSAMIY